ncbi:chloride channel protein [Phycisphaera mikurensis]|nr:chloride channel protein [Phycisphaera mikurensis]MBB6442297.1 CIC family chloride channel protein [Phycisphaera mikurensis]
MRWWSRSSEALRRRFGGTGWRLMPMAAAVGAAMGVVAVAFDRLVGEAGRLIFSLPGGRAFAGVDLVLLVLLPAGGGLLVGLISLLAGRLTPLSRGPGIPVVVEALARRDGDIPAEAGLFRAVTASLTIGSGGSAGVEGPIILIGSALSSALARLGRVSAEQRRTLVGCGAAAATAAIFNAPIAAVIFVLEVILRDFSTRTFAPIVVASVFGTVTAQAILGRNEAVFEVVTELNIERVFTGQELAHYAVLGVLAGLVGAGVSASVRAAERVGKRAAGPPWLKPALGGALLGLLGVVWMATLGPAAGGGTEAPPFFGNGYPVIERLLRPETYAQEGGGVVLLAALLGFKLLGTCLTLGSGGAGGVIAPSLMIGATLGALFASVCTALGAFPGESPATYAFAGMAGLIAAVAGCPLAAFLLVFEITGDYQLILPAMLVAILATGVAQLFVPDSIYVAMLRERGVRTGAYADYTLLRRLHARDVPLVPAVTVRPEAPAAELLALSRRYAVTDFVVVDASDGYVGLVTAEDFRALLLAADALPLVVVGELMRTGLPPVNPDHTLDLVMEQFSRHDVAGLPVVDGGGRIRGMLTRVMLIRSYQETLAARG